MPELITFDATPFDAPDTVTRTGKIFQIGSYEDKQFSLSEAEADAAITTFAPVDLELEHFLSEGRPSILDGKLGTLRRVWRQGADLFGEVTVPSWLDPIWAETGRKISAVWDRPTKQLTRSGLVLHPRVTDAALYAAFAGARHNHSDQAALDSAHAAIVQAGATCPAQPMKEARMSFMEKVGAWFKAGMPADFDEGSVLLSAPAAAPDPRVAELERQVADQQATFAAQAAAAAAQAATARQTAAVTFADTLVTTGVILPALRPVALAAYAQALADDAITPGSVTFSDATGKETTGSRAEVLAALFAGLGTPAAPLTTEHIPAGTVVLSAMGGDADPAKVAARLAALLTLTPLGTTAAHQQQGKVG